MERLPGFNVANHFEKRQLLIAINCVAALSIFFFGYVAQRHRSLNLMPTSTQRQINKMRSKANTTMQIRPRCNGWRE